MKNNNYISKVKTLHPEWKYEYDIKFLDNFHVFSLEKNHSDVELFKSFISIDELIKLDDLSLIKKRHQDFIDLLYDNQVNGIHLLPKKRLSKRAPVPIESDINSVFEKRKQDSVIEELDNIANEFQINDPIFKEQWHIKNTAFPGNDVNVVPVWRMGITGKGIVTALIDDGLDYESNDLKDNYSPEGSWDYNDNRPNPKPMLTSDYHGTRCAAEIAASKGNDYCGVGVAYDSKVAGIRILSGEITSEQEAAAMIYGLDVNDIYSCSWGPPDNGRTMDAPDKLIKSAILKGIQDGRNGKGAVYVFASGNGGNRGDTCNFDGYTNSIYSLTVSAIDYKGLHPGYSESCTAVMVSTYSSGSGEHIHTTDINDRCTDQHGGTSAAAPLAAGIYALVLEANPDLTWRDVQYLTVLSAGEIDPFHESWQKSAIPDRKYSPMYGWGKTDAEKMVKMAQSDWKLLKPQSWYYSTYQDVNLEINNKIDEVSHSLYISPEILKKANLDHIEQITITVDIKSGKRGDVEVDLVSPNGIISNLAKSRFRDTDTNGFPKWTFSTVAHWGEDPSGNWTLKVRNVAETNSITFQGWQLRTFGECIDPSLAKRFNVDEDYSRINFESDNQEEVTTSVNPESSTTTETMEQPSITENPEQLSTVEASQTTAELTTSEILDSTVLKPTETSENVVPFETTVIPSKPTAVPGTGNKQSGNESYKNSDEGHHYFWYFFTLLVIGLGALIYIIKNRKKPGRARRREDFEFDIIRPEDDESSRFEFDDDNSDDFNISDDDHHDNRLDNDSNKGFNNMKLDSASEFDLGNSELSGFEKSQAIIKDARIKESNEEKNIYNKQHRLESDNEDEYEEDDIAEETSATLNVKSQKETDRLIL
jgi:kexin